MLPGDEEKFITDIFVFSTDTSSMIRLQRKLWQSASSWLNVSRWSQQVRSSSNSPLPSLSRKTRELIPNSSDKCSREKFLLKFYTTIASRCAHFTNVTLSSRLNISLIPRVQCLAPKKLAQQYICLDQSLSWSGFSSFQWVAENEYLLKRTNGDVWQWARDSHIRPA